LEHFLRIARPQAIVGRHVINDAASGDGSRKGLWIAQVASIGFDFELANARRIASQYSNPISAIN
jgi:hypothetical protein